MGSTRLMTGPGDEPVYTVSDLTDVPTAEPNYMMHKVVGLDELTDAIRQLTRALILTQQDR